VALGEGLPYPAGVVARGRGDKAVAESSRAEGSEQEPTVYLQRAGQRGRGARGPRGAPGRTTAALSLAAGITDIGSSR
jgi:hypothetical protein